MSETKRLEASARVTGAVRGVSVNGALVYNENPYPVEVTVRRVVESTSFVIEYGSSAYMNQRVLEALRGRGYDDVTRFRVTIEPLP